VLLRTDRLLHSSAIPVLVLAVPVSVGAFWALMSLDPLFRGAIAGWRTPGFRAAMEWVTLFGQGWVLGAIGLAVALIGRRLGRRDLFRAGLVAVPALVASELVGAGVLVGSGVGEGVPGPTVTVGAGVKVGGRGVAVGISSGTTI